MFQTVSDWAKKKLGKLKKLKKVLILKALIFLSKKLELINFGSAMGM